MLTKTMGWAIKLANEYEHLEVHIRSPREISPKVKNYGSLFLGKWYPVVPSDKLVGANHILPTLRAARYSGSLFVGSFLKTLAYQCITREASPKLAAMAAKQSRY